jgi:hypothetical protein
MRLQEKQIDNASGSKPAANERFAASGGVARPKSSENLQVLRPAQTAVSRHLRQAATTLSATRGQCGADSKVRILKLQIQAN